MLASKKESSWIDQVCCALSRFTHVLSIEMFEHMKGYPHLFAKVATWLKPRGKVFIHVFVHKDTPYEFEDDDGWMSKHFFSGGTMPSVSPIDMVSCSFSTTNDPTGLPIYSWISSPTSKRISSCKSLGSFLAIITHRPSNLGCDCKIPTRLKV